MERGYSLAYSESGELLKSAKQVNIKDMVRINLADGMITCNVMDKKERI